MDEREYHKWDLIVKAMTVVSVGITFIWGIIQYRETARRDTQVRLELAEREYRRVFWDKQIQTYFELSTAAVCPN